MRTWRIGIKQYANSEEPYLVLDIKADDVAIAEEVVCELFPHVKRYLIARVGDGKTGRERKHQAVYDHIFTYQKETLAETLLFMAEEELIDDATDDDFIELIAAWVKCK